jgi:hypothetical protein
LATLWPSAIPNRVTAANDDGEMDKKKNMRKIPRRGTHRMGYEKQRKGSRKQQLSFSLMSLGRREPHHWLIFFCGKPQIY